MRWFTMNRVRQLREERRMSGYELAELLNLSHQQVYDLEKGKRRLNEDTLRALSKIFSVTTDYILGLADRSQPSKVAESQGRYIATPHSGDGIDIQALVERTVEEALDRRLGQAKESPADYPLAAHNRGDDDVDVDGLLKHIDERARVVEERERKK
jgi:transcriptional regulator with XRE-family HTH domain